MIADQIAYRQCVFFDKFPYCDCQHRETISIKFGKKSKFEFSTKTLSVKLIDIIAVQFSCWMSLSIRAYFTIRLLSARNMTYSKCRYLPQKTAVYFELQISNENKVNKNMDYHIFLQLHYYQLSKTRSNHHMNVFKKKQKEEITIE